MGIQEGGEFKKDFELKNQITSSVISIMANIAEGFHRKSNRDFMKFLDYARSSIAETLSHCYIGLDQKYLDETELQKVKEQSEIIWKKINHLIAYLNKCKTF